MVTFEPGELEQWAELRPSTPRRARLAELARTVLQVQTERRSGADAVDLQQREQAALSELAELLDERGARRPGVPLERR